MFVYCGDNPVNGFDKTGRIDTTWRTHTDGKNDRYYENILLNLDLTYAKYPYHPKTFRETINGFFVGVGKLASAFFKSIDCKGGVGAGFEVSAGSGIIDASFGGHDNPLQLHLQNGSLTIEEEEYVGCTTGSFGHNVGLFLRIVRPLGEEPIETKGFQDGLFEPRISISSGSIFVAVGLSWDVSFDFGVFVKCLLEK